MTTDLGPLIVTASPGIGIKERTREGVAPLAGATKILGVCPQGLEPPWCPRGDLNTKSGAISPDGGNHAATLHRR